MKSGGLKNWWILQMGEAPGGMVTSGLASLVGPKIKNFKLNGSDQTFFLQMLGEICLFFREIFFFSTVAGSQTARQ